MDKVELNNLQRQILHATNRVGIPGVGGLGGGAFGR